MTTTNAGIMTLPAGTALNKYTRLKISSNTWVYAGVGEDHDAICGNNYASGDQAIGLLHSMPDTFKLTMATTFVAGDIVYGAANGQGSTTKSGNPIGKCINASASTGGIAEILKLIPEGSRRAWHHFETVTGAGPYTITHPFAAAPGGCIVSVYKGSDGTVRVLTNVAVGASSIVITDTAGATGDNVSIIAWDSSDA